MSTAVERLGLVGVGRPDVVTESNLHPGPKQWTLTVKQDPGFTDEDMVTSLVSDLTVILVGSQHSGTRTDCPADPATAAQQALDSQNELGSWLSVRAGRSPEDARSSSDPRTGHPSHAPSPPA